MGLESKFNRYMENGYPGWQELERAKFDSAAGILFQEIVNSEPLSNDMIIAEATFLALSGATNSRKQYKEVEEFFDEVWDGEFGSITLCLLKAVNKYNVRFTEKRQKV